MVVIMAVSIPGRDSGSLEPKHRMPFLRAMGLFQSLEGIQALWNFKEVSDRSSLHCVSIPGRDSGSLELKLMGSSTPGDRVSIPGRDSGSLEPLAAFDIFSSSDWFQSLEGIQALWNNQRDR